MAMDDFSKWPLVYQLLAGVGAIGAGFWAFIRGGIKKGGDFPSPADAAERELTRLRDQHLADRDRQIHMEIQAIRADFKIIIESLKENFNERFDRLEEVVSSLARTLHDLDKLVALIDDRQSRSRS